MNAKKIMGAVLVALLAAALFTGAVAAADNGTVFMYQKNVQNQDGIWTNGAYTVIIDGGVVKSDNFVPGTYKKGDDTLYITYPTATYSAGAKVNTIAYLIGNNGKVYQPVSDFDLVVSSAAKLNPTQIQVTYPSGEVSTTSVGDFETDMNDETVAAGTYKIQAIFADSDFVTGLDSDYLLDTFNSFTFTVVSEDDATISATVDTLYNGEFTFITIEGTIGKEYTLVLDGFDIKTNQFTGVNNPINPVAGTPGEYTVKMPNSGKLTLQIKANTTEDEATASLKGIKDAEVEIKISAPVVTATVGANSYFVGDIIKIAGTSSSAVADGDFTFKIAGTNFKETDLSTAKVTGDDTKFDGKEWKIAFDTAKVKDAEGKKLDVGTYTIKIYQGSEVVKTVAVVLKQPFISIVSAPEVVAQNTDAEFVINAEAAEDVKAYFFGTNYFAEADKVEQDADLKNQFTVTLKDTTTNNMSTGQYFAVFQHPMYDTYFNINATATGEFYLNTKATATADNGQFLFKFNDRQTANAAQALCDALDSQNIDDMYVKYSFFVVGKDAAFTISEIPSEIAKGTTLTISGVDTANAEKTVVVEMISTAFAALPKETVGSAAFIVVTTEVAEDGTWEVTLDTSDLNVDEYSLSVVINDATKKNVKVNVVEAADEPVTPPTDEPGQDEPGQDEPVAPETPGFGALAALAGLGAVAVLLLRRE